MPKDLSKQKQPAERDALDVRSLSRVITHLFADMSEAVIVADRDRRIVMANEAADRLFRYAPGELEGRSAAVLYDSVLDYEAKASRFNPEADGGHDRYVVRYRRGDATVFEGETIGGPIPGEHPGEVLFLGIVRDVSERLAADQVLEQLYEITSNPALSFETSRRQILALGCRYFGMSTGDVSRVDGQRYEVISAWDIHGEVEPGALFPLAETFCYQTLSRNGPFAVDQVGATPLAAHSCYKRFQFESFIGAPLRLRGELIGAVGFSGRASTGAFSEHDLKLVGMFGQWLSHEMDREHTERALREARDRLECLASHDELTGLGNRRLLIEHCERELERGRRQGRALSVALIDFDHFKQVNDIHGHAAGDAALRYFADTARETLRGADVIGRWGGEEFMVLMPDTHRRPAKQAVERLLAGIRGGVCETGGTQLALTASAGVTTTECEESLEDILQRADSALYLAKDRGRDRVEMG